MIGLENQFWSYTWVALLFIKSKNRIAVKQQALSLSLSQRDDGKTR